MLSDTLYSEQLNLLYMYTTLNVVSVVWHREHAAEVMTDARCIFGARWDESGVRYSRRLRSNRNSDTNDDLHMVVVHRS